MQRGRRIVLLAHCLLNVNARVDGLATYAGIHPLVHVLAERGYGVVQLPCPELLAEGADREPRPVEAYDTPAFGSICAALADQVQMQVRLHLDAGDAVPLLVGVEGSPSCGVDVTNVGAGDAPWSPGEPTVRVPGCGVFARALRERLAPLGVAFAAVDNHDADLGVDRVMRALEDGESTDV